MSENKKKEQVVENQETEVSQEEQLSSLDLVWKFGFDQLDGWAEQLNRMDDLFLGAVYNYVDRVKNNQENLKVISEQFNKELKDWEKSAREELLVTTTTLQRFFPINSYEEINQVVDDIQNKTTTLLLTPVQSLTGEQGLDNYLETVEKYISFRKESRGKFIDSVKNTTNVLYENQKLFVNLFAKQVKTAIFPFQKYLKNLTEVTNS
ncbi:hypothetical protein [Neobacillus massiliamazoniensis]|jgi:hypothetical protein|uniref:Uncharacterized protein n=1 Tax=Neobacillus massiliamazoniensis TaxID=1499688 RepID=A0A0U1NSN9_9BACI|nr:hypothetical protein [Neobacillus massiliamazoniensis]CRK80738.1 hypothetical protein BN000_00626 [Neobacillus massiliamazoniensis]